MKIQPNPANKREYLREDTYGVWHEIFEWDVYRITEEEMKDRVVVEIGGHYGYAALRFIDLGAKKVLSFEPNPVNFVKFIQNTKDYPQIQGIGVACGTTTGDIISITNDGCRSTCSLIAPPVGGDVFRVPTISVQDILGLCDPEDKLVLKMDAEGIEHILFKAYPAEIWRRFETIGIEVHGETYFGKGNTFDGIINLIKSYGFEMAFMGVGTFTDEKGVTTKNEDLAVCKFKRIG
jgi:FkbM family methyltransferase